MTRGRIDKRQRQADLLRKKRAQAASTLTQGAKTVAAMARQASVSRAEPLPPMSYPLKKAQLGKRQAPEVVAPIGRADK